MSVCLGQRFIDTLFPVREIPSAFCLIRLLMKIICNGLGIDFEYKKLMLPLLYFSVFLTKNIRCHFIGSFSLITSLSNQPTSPRATNRFLTLQGEPNENGKTLSGKDNLLTRSKKKRKKTAAAGQYTMKYEVFQTERYRQTIGFICSSVGKRLLLFAKKWTKKAQL